MTNDDINLSSTQPYFVRALYEWCLDNNLTPYIMVEAIPEDIETQVPRAFVRDNQIVLNIGAKATPNLVIDNDSIQFSARFGGVAHQIYVPFRALKGIYPKEYQEFGLFFEIPADAHLQAVNAKKEPEEQEQTKNSETTTASAKETSKDNSKPRGSHLKVIK